MQRLFGPPGPPLGPTPMQPLPRGPFMFGPGPSVAQSSFFGTGPQAATNLMQGAGGRMGLLSRLFGGAGAGQAFAGPGIANVASSGGFLSNINLGTILQNTQRVMGITQQVMPMVQQYGPLIRNAPAIWRIMRSQSASEPSGLEEVEDPSPQSVPITIETTEIESETPTIKTPQASASTQPTPTMIGGVPAPKLYV